jgi:hypothetical protein
MMSARTQAVVVAIFFCLLAALVLVGCATTPQTPLLAHVETQIVKVPVNVRCVSLTELPVIPKTRMEPGDAIASAATIAELVKAIERWVIEIQIDFNNLEDYVIRADALLRACATEPQPSTDAKGKP